MMHFVLDASAILSAFLADEAGEYARKLVTDYCAKGSIVHVPALWHIEIRNVLFRKEKQGKMPKGSAGSILQALEKFLIITDKHMSDHDELETIDILVKEYGLTAYDATYVELALRLGLPIATLDEDIIRVAKGLKIDMVP